MARNQEKAQTMLARWLRYKEESVKGPKQRRPYLASLCTDLHEAEKWRGTIIKDISRNVAEIQNAALGEHRIRDINDRINKLFREKRHWERQIKELGGKEYKRNNYGGYGHGTYLYFGAAKDLPGVRELLQNDSNYESWNNKIKNNKSTSKKYVNKDRCNGKDKRSRKEMYNSINIDYYGFGDDDNSELLWNEKLKEQSLRKAKIEQWNKKHGNIGKNQKKRNFYSILLNETGKNENENENVNSTKRRKRMRLTKIASHIPTQEEIDKAILQKRKQMLLQKYVENEESEDAKNLAKQVKIQEIIKQNTEEESSTTISKNSN